MSSVINNAALNKNISVSSGGSVSIELIIILVVLFVCVGLLVLLYICLRQFGKKRTLCACCGQQKAASANGRNGVAKTHAHAACHSGPTDCHANLASASTSNAGVHAQEDAKLLQDSERHVVTSSSVLVVPVPVPVPGSTVVNCGAES